MRKELSKALCTLCLVISSVCFAQTASTDRGDSLRSEELYRLLFLQNEPLDKALLSEARDLWKRLAEEDEANAQLYLSLIYFEGLAGVEQNTAYAVHLISKSAAGGNRDAQYFMGRSIESGEFHERNTELALCWYRLSANNGGFLARERLKQAHSSGELGLVPGSEVVGDSEWAEGCNSP